LFAISQQPSEPPATTQYIESRHGRVSYVARFAFTLAGAQSPPAAIQKLLHPELGAVKPGETPTEGMTPPELPPLLPPTDGTDVRSLTETAFADEQA
jgi:hypothetical protein